MRSLQWLLGLPFRLAGTLLVIAGFAAGFYDLYLSVESGQTVLTSLGETAAMVSPDLFGLRPAAEAGGGDALGSVLGFLLDLPSFLALLILATLCLLVAQLIYRPE